MYYNIYNQTIQFNSVYFYQVKNTTVVLYVSVEGVKLMEVLSTFFCHVAMDGAVILVVNTKPTVEYAKPQ